MPYISSSIIVQLLTGVSDYFKHLKSQGETGRAKITQITRYGTVLLATIQGYGLSIGLESSPNLVINPGLFFKITTVSTIVAGTMFLMWLGEQITQRGIGNGISLIIFAGIVAEIPRALGISATIPAKIINEIPFPIPLCVICSPNHIKNIVPATIVETVVILKNRPGFITKFGEDSRPIDNP